VKGYIKFILSDHELTHLFDFALGVRVLSRMSPPVRQRGKTWTFRPAEMWRRPETNSKQSHGHVSLLRLSVRRSTCVLTSVSQRVHPCKFQESRKTESRLLRLARPLVKITGEPWNIKAYNPQGLQASLKISSYTRVSFSTLTSSRCGDD
jgi:hypothetical protein